MQQRHRQTNLRHLGVLFCIGQGVVQHLTDIPTESNRKGFSLLFLFFSLNKAAKRSEAKRHIIHHTPLFSVLGKAFVISLGHLSSLPMVSPQPRVRSFWILTSVSLHYSAGSRAGILGASTQITGQGLFRITGGLRLDFLPALFFVSFFRISFSSKIRGTAAMHEARLCPRQNILWILDSHAYYFQPSFFCYFDSSS